MASRKTAAVKRKEGPTPPRQPLLLPARRPLERVLGPSFEQLEAADNTQVSQPSPRRDLIEALDLSTPSAPPVTAPSPPPLRRTSTPIIDNTWRDPRSSVASSDDELFTVYEDEEEDESDSLPLPPNNTSVPEVEEQHEETQQEQREELEDVDLSRMDVDELEEAPPPGNHQPPLPADVTAQPVLPTEEEMMLRTQFEEELHQAETHLQGRKVTRASTALDSVIPNLNQLKTLAFRRISLIQDPAVKAATTTEWRTYYNKQLDEEERVAMLITNARVPDQTAENKKKAARSKVSRAIKALVNEMVQKIPFGPGRFLTGYHPEVVFTNPVLNPTARKAAYHINISKPSSKSPICLRAKERPLDFYESEMLGYDVPARCDSCMNCQHCTLQKEGITVKEKKELQDMKDNIWLDSETKTVTVSYPFLSSGDIKSFRDNRQQALQRAEKSYQSLKKRGKLDEFQEQWDDFIKLGVLEEVTEDVIEDWKEPAMAWRTRTVFPQN